MLQRFRRLNGVVDCDIDWQTSHFRHNAAEVLTGNKLHRQVGYRGVQVRVKHHHKVGMIQQRGRLDLLLKPLANIGIGQQSGLD